MQASDGSTTVSYGYDALGRRISRTKETGAQKEETQWVLDTARPYSEIVLERTKQNGGAWQETRYTHTPDGVGQLISKETAGQVRHVFEDAQGSTRLVTDDSGQIIEVLDFDAFGNEPNPDPASPTRHRYTGESYDSATGLYHLRARDYDPKTGRFISMDAHPGSQSIPLTLNKYLYGNADPVNHIDPGGDFSLGGMMSGIGNIVNVSMRVMNLYSTFVDPWIDNFDTEIPRLWDAMMQLTLGGAMGLFGSVDSAMITTPHQLSLPLGGKTNEHHSIPVYLCGAISFKVQPAATIDKRLHDAIHTNLDAMTATINIAGKAVDLALTKNRSRITKPTIMRLARTKGGRGIIVGALSAFYTFNDLWHEGGDKPGTYSIGEAFSIYSPQYIVSREKTSIYQRCS